MDGETRLQMKRKPIKAAITHATFMMVGNKME